jgi:hypothetical protein
MKGIQAPKLMQIISSEQIELLEGKSILSGLDDLNSGHNNTVGAFIANRDRLNPPNKSRLRVP